MILPYALFHSLFFAAVILGLVEASYLVLTVDDLSVYQRLLAAFYIISPFALFGITVAALTAALVTVWARTKRVTSPQHGGPPLRVDILAAFLATVAFVLALFLSGQLLFEMSEERAKISAVLSVATPILALGSLYLWAVLRTQIARVYQKLGPRTSTVIGLFFSLITAALPVLIIASNESLAIFLGEWSVVFVLGYPTLVLIIALCLIRFASQQLSGPGIRRLLLLLTICAAAGTANLVYSLDESPEVKSALLDNTLVFHPLIVTAQPLFDRDGDGYAGELGGGDCDDSDPAVHPGASEIPRNAIDDDCFGGDSPGRRKREGIQPIQTLSAVSRGLVDRPNIILVTLDTVRADHMGYQGYERNTTPRLDALAEKNLRFSWAFAQGAQTRVSMASMFTGKYYSEVDRGLGDWARIHNSNVTLAERLSASGYHTAGIPSHRFFLPSYGLNQGFKDWDLSIVERHQRKVAYRVTGSEVTDRAIEYLGEQDPDGRPLFLWLHYFDPHFAYKSHDDYDFGDSDLDRYDAEIRYTDEQVGRLLDWLETSPLGGKTYVVIHSDHGEGFGLHGYRYHGQHLYNDQVHVPLIIAGPGIRSMQIDTPVSLIDIVPTVLDLAGVPRSSDLRGMSLIAYSTDVAPPKHPPVFIEMLKDSTHSDRRAIVQWPWKLQWRIDFDDYTLYNLAQDPNEQRDLRRVRKADLARLKQQLRRWNSEDVERSTPTREDPGMVSAGP